MKLFNKMNIRTKIILVVLGISIFSFISFLLTTQINLNNEMNVSIDSINGLGEKASSESETALITQSSRYLNRLIASEAYLSNYLFKIIQYQITVAKNALEDLYNHSEIYNTPKFERLTSTSKNPDLKFYYTLAPNVNEESVYSEIKRIGSLHSLLRALLENNREKEILPKSVDGIYIGTSTGIFFNMTWNAYYNKDYDARKREWFRNAQETGHSGWTKPYKDDASKTHTVTYYQPIYDSNNVLRAVIGMDVTLEAMIDLIDLHFKDVGSAIVLDDSGTIINFENLDSKILDFISADSGNMGTSSNDELLEFYTHKVEENGSGENSQIIKYKRISKQVVFAPISVPNLRIIILSSLQEIEESIKRTEEKIQETTKNLSDYSSSSFTKTLLIIFIVFAVILLLSILILIRFSKLLTNPISLLIKKVEIIGNGNLDEKLEINTGDELEILANAFNKMTEDLKNYIKTLNETTAAKERIESELQIAHKIQASMLPRIFPPFPNRDEFDIYASMTPAKDVGGDYFDFFFIDDYRLCFTIGDVSGKGIPGSLFMVITKTLMKMEASGGRPLDEVVRNVNNVLCKDNDELLFVTTIIFSIDLRTGKLEYVNAGHNPPLIKKHDSKDFQFLDLIPGFVLGAKPNFQFQSESLNLLPGEVLFLYTDGVTEAMNSDSKQYTTKRLHEKLSNISITTALSIEKAISEDLQSFVNDTPQSDDITMLAFKFNCLSQPAEEAK